MYCSASFWALRCCLMPVKGKHGKRGRPLKMSVLTRAEQLPPIVSAAELADLMGITKMGLYKQYKRLNGRTGVLPEPLPRIGVGNYKFLREEIIAWLTRGRVA